MAWNEEKMQVLNLAASLGYAATCEGDHESALSIAEGCLSYAIDNEAPAEVIQQLGGIAATERALLAKQRKAA